MIDRRRSFAAIGAVLAVPFGALAQLGERLACNQEVVGSSPTSSIPPVRMTTWWWRFGDSGEWWFQSDEYGILRLPFLEKWRKRHIPFAHYCEWGKVLTEHELSYVRRNPLLTHWYDTSGQNRILRYIPGARM